ncbi:hypothetical protein B5X24_HaOG202190 [Helicoverpa armigera]|uniref:Uncharacterized protein n=1 Tax=Helicoverpa armigera TaxID=29058 RepID=A0A2W1C0F4_HELAM|nr:hypothetical protein B5X24_HaOG202190 [Helicoverpa armigera]
MKLYSFLFLLFIGFANCQVISNVRLVDHISYVIDYITRTVQTVEERGWYNLKLYDYVIEVNQTVNNLDVIGKVQYRNGFVTSIQRVDIQQSTVQQVWGFNSTAKKTTVSVRGTLRLHDVAVGYDVTTDIGDGEDDEIGHYTMEFVHPLITYAFSVIKDVNTDEIEVTVVANVPRVTNRQGEFRPTDSTTDILTSMFDPNVGIPAGMIGWADKVFQPIAYDLVTKEIQFPRICYDCAT